MSGEHTSHGVGNAKEGIMAEITWKSILTKLVGETTLLLRNRSGSWTT